MGWQDALLQEAAPVNYYLAARTDGLAGTGTAQDPFNGAARRHPPVRISLKFSQHASGREAEATVLTPTHPFVEGDVLIISGVTGLGSNVWNGTFGIYNVLPTTFNFLLSRITANPEGSPTAVRLTFPFDELMREMPAKSRICLGPGVYQTRGFAPNDSRGWQPKSGQKIVGAGMDTTTLQLVGAENADQHYHVVGMPIEPSGTAPISPWNSSRFPT